MLYYIGYSPSAGGWTSDFNRAILAELDRWAIRYVQLPPYDWTVTTPPISFYRRFRSAPGDVWLVAWAQSPAIELIQRKPGRKFGFAAGLAAIPFEPAGPWSHLLRERERLTHYEAVFFPSEWAAGQARQHYPELAGRFIVSGFPIDFEALEPYRWERKIDRLVVFNQRFAVEKLPALEVELGRRLAVRGHSVWHLTGEPEHVLVRRSPEISGLISVAKSSGIRIVHNPSKQIYLRRLAMARVVVTTSLADTLSVATIEGIALGTAPVAPRAMAFQEYIHPDNLYQPYDLDEIERLVTDPPQRRHMIFQHCRQRVVQTMVGVMFPGLTADRCL